MTRPIAKKDFIPISVSRLDKARCLKQFHDEYIGKIHPTDPGNQYSEWGNHVHKQLELYVQGTIQQLPDDVKHLQDMADYLKNLGSQFKLFVELKIGLDRNYNPCENTDWDHCYCRAILDYTAVTIDEKYAISLDYKTGKSKEDIRQLVFNGIALFTWFPKLVAILTDYIWLKEPYASKPVILYRNQLQQYIQQLENEAAPVQEAFKNNNWPTNPSRDNCRWCRSNPKNGGNCGQAIN